MSTATGRIGLTLVEVMVALTMTLIVLGAMMSAFQYASQEMAGGRAMMELANRVRSAETLLRSDLAGLTVEARPYTETTYPPGYFEYIEGPVRDVTSWASDAVHGYLGDVDDVLCMTVRNQHGAFRGRSTSGSIESPLAEVIWFTTFEDRDGDSAVGFTESVRLHRRALLIRPDFGQMRTNISASDVHDFFKANDISARVEQGSSSTNYNVIANTLEDLAHRGNRYCHAGETSSGLHFPHNLQRDADPTISWLDLRRPDSQDDIVLTDVAAFDLKIYSPDASVKDETDMIVEPSDPGYSTSASAAIVRGAYVDLNHGSGGWFSGLPHSRSQITGPGLAYDTWTPEYERDGRDQDGDGAADEATNGLDDDGSNGVDDTMERETMPPYPNPVRGMQVTIRLIEKDSKQVHQSSIKHSFVPE